MEGPDVQRRGEVRGLACGRDHHGLRDRADREGEYASLTYAEGRARDWKAGIVEVGALGHINGASGLGSWPEGRRLLTAFRSGTRYSNA
ncbi:alpha/beta hydrolase [Sphingomonas sanguinis]|uniref:alpha/beta hydrolase n=1 Tax=Sphingomonas sanguinis TaxID=33051 RepID=UPI0030B888ED